MLTRYFRGLLGTLPSNLLEDWGKYRWQDQAHSVQWLYKRTGDNFLCDLAHLLQVQGYNWTAVFHPFENSGVTLRRSLNSGELMKEWAVLSPDTAGHPRDHWSSDTLQSEAHRRELLQLIFRSTQFAKSERLRALLTYVCEISFKGSADKLNEQRIRRFVFGRAKDYDSFADGIVRS